MNAKNLAFKYNYLFLGKILLPVKNFTPLQLTIYISSFVAILTGVILTIMKFIFFDVNWQVIVFNSLLIFLISFIIIRYALERFLYRKIKLIYKSIYTLKSKSKNLPKVVDLKEDIFTEIKNEVVEWAKKNQLEFDELKNTENYRREFLANVSHELKTPIFNIQGYLHTLMDGGLEDERINHKYIEKAITNLDRLNDIVKDLEIISKLEAGELPIEKTRFDIAKTCKEVIESIEILAEKKNIHVNFKDGHNKSKYVLADRDKITQVITNLLANSLKYGKEGGQTLISIYDMDINILIEISDDGIGIEKEHLPRLFERFYRVDKARTRTEGGTGLGLSIVKHIIEAHGQTINVRSTAGVGSTFGFTLEKAK
jgi:two-component system phosphate regulon sensor histidine kinase PhoR